MLEVWMSVHDSEVLWQKRETRRPCFCPFHITSPLPSALDVFVAKSTAVLLGFAWVQKLS